MRNAILIGDTGVAGVGKNRWECPYCRENKSPECRFNLSFMKINVTWKCRFCKGELFLLDPKKAEEKHEK
jgi:hypothetical protein